MNPYDPNNQGFNPYQAPTAETYDDDYESDLLDEPNRLSAGDGMAWVGASWRIFKERPLLWIGVFFVYMLIVGGVSVIPGIGAFASGILGVMFMAGFAYMAYGIDMGEDVGFGDMFAGIQQAPKPLFMLWLVQFLAALAVMVPMIIVMFLTMGGISPTSLEQGTFSPMMMLMMLVMMLFIIPIAMATVFSPILVFFHELSPTEAMKLSFKACLRNILPMLVFGIVMSVVGFIAMIPLGLGLLAVVPMGLISVYVMYKDILIG